MSFKKLQRVVAMWVGVGGSRVASGGRGMICAILCLASAINGAVSWGSRSHVV
jgi:hypothetical protein